MGDAVNGWQTVLPTTRVDRLERVQRETVERQALDSWAKLDGDWSGYGKHTTEYAQAKKLHSKLRAAVIQPLGRGGQGEVEKLKYTHKNRSVELARKRLRGVIEELREEADILEQLCHDHIVRLIGTYGYHPKELYLLLWPAATRDLADLLKDLDDLRFDGGDREDILERLQDLDLTNTAAIDNVYAITNPSRDSSDHCPLSYLQRIMGCLTDAIGYCHDQNIRHLDLKPENILVSPGRVHLADFGISRDVSDQEQTNTFLEIGTKKWFAPERFPSDQGWSMQAADVYSLGLIFLNISAIIYGARQAHLFDILKQVDWQIKLRQLDAYLEDLQKLALATQEFADDKANTFAPKHVVGLIRCMTSLDKSKRPDTAKVNAELVRLGGLEQIYHNSCCKRPARVLVQLLDREYAQASMERDRLAEENERIGRQLQVYKDRDDMYDLRIRNEREKHAKDRERLLKQLEEEQKHRRQLEAQLWGPEQHRRHRSSVTAPERSASGGLMMKTTRQPAKSPSQQPSKPVTTPSVNNPPLLRSPTSNTGKGPTSDLRKSTDSLAGSGLLRTSTSASRLPQPVKPSTPIRSSTPSTPRDTNLTDTTTTSIASSLFSRSSRRTTGSGLSPNPSPSSSNILARPDAQPDGSAAPDATAKLPPLSSYFPRGLEAPRHVVNAESEAGSVGTDLAELDLLHDNQSQAGTDASDLPGPTRVPSLPVDKSWAAIAGDRRGLANMISAVTSKKKKT
ncbi:uncharacterized protein JN550_007364 [Neoarthrinium moseri]|uniref:uncharacterized protein n=1 Tax=Neoarthrinium moseri TaxID=1658444 RepID=UPI001FDD7897|nr:uncharacterized protein JN550_007364 [Neoarthrinium moseri]KAI1866817.1 hypothetical protein JN550_007364 [Neoarthrinium moseri]